MRHLQSLARVSHLGIETLPAAVRYRLRNWLALGRWATGSTRSWYDDAFWDFQHDADWETFARCILEHAPGVSIIDVGCGEGNLIAAMRDVHPDRELAGVDGSGVALRRASERGLAVQATNLAIWRRRDANRLRDVVAGHDLAICLETAEHLPPWSAPHLVHALAGAPTVVFSAARPDQGGTLHMNERPFAYWERLFNREGLSRATCDDAFRRAVASIRVPYWYADNIHVLVRG